MVDVYFYEAFEEEAVALRRHLPADWRAGFTAQTIQESGDQQPPAKLISVRTQSIIPPAWHAQLVGIVSRTTGHDHLVGCSVPSGHLPLYCNRAVGTIMTSSCTFSAKSLFPAFGRRLMNNCGG